MVDTHFTYLHAMVTFQINLTEPACLYCLFLSHIFLCLSPSTFYPLISSGLFILSHISSFMAVLLCLLSPSALEKNLWDKWYKASMGHYNWHTRHRTKMYRHVISVGITGFSEKYTKLQCNIIHVYTEYEAKAKPQCG